MTRIIAEYSACMESRRQPNILNASGVLLQVSLHAGKGRRLLQQARLADEHAHVAAFLVGVEIQGDARVAGDMAQLGGARLAKDQGCLAIPVEPDGPGLGSMRGVDGGKPDGLFFFKALLDALTDGGGEIWHGNDSWKH